MDLLVFVVLFVCEEDRMDGDWWIVQFLFLMVMLIEEVFGLMKLREWVVCGFEYKMKVFIYYVVQLIGILVEGVIKYERFVVIFFMVCDGVVKVGCEVFWQCYDGYDWLKSVRYIRVGVIVCV